MKYSLFLAAIILLAACKNRKTASDEILSEFKKVNESLERSNKELLEKNSFEFWFLEISLLKDKDPELFQRADSLYMVAHSTIRFMKELKAHLQASDSTGENLDVATYLLVTGPSGSTLTELLMKVNNAARACAPYADTNIIVESAPVAGEEKKWKEKYFQRTPTIGAITIVNKFEMDVRNTSYELLKKMYVKLKK